MRRAWVVTVIRIQGILLFAWVLVRSSLPAEADASRKVPSKSLCPLISRLSEESIQVINFLISYNATVGPGAPIMNNVPRNPAANGGGYNPRCMRRDVNSEVALGATAEKSYNLITLSKDINTFYNTLLTPPVNRSDPYNWGIHNSGHYISGGDPGGDPMVSPGDPIFYFHHAMLDRLWWIWQMQDPDNRVNAQVTLGGTSTNRKIDLKWLIADVIPVLEAHDGLGGHGGAFCHVYV